MRKNLSKKALIYPQPVFIVASYGADGTPDAMNAAWGGVAGDDKIFMCISPSHKTAENILARKAFTVSMGDAAHVKECDYVGVVSANKEPDKLAKCGFHTTKSEFVDAPLIDELPLTLECRLISYDPETHYLFGEIVNVSADESILDEAGNVSAAKLRPITVDPASHDYLVLGEKVGSAFKDGFSIK